MTQVSEKEIAAVAFLCDSQGVVRQILYDGLGTGLIAAGQSIESALDEGSCDKCRAFLDTVLSKGAAYGWEMNATVDGRVRSLRFSANATGEGIFVAAGITTASIVQIYERFIHVQNSAARTVTRPPVPPQFDDDAELYNELARLNNDLVTVQRELIKRNIELERLNEVKNEFIGVAAHDLRNPLQVIQGYSTMLLNKRFGDLTAEQQKFVATIKRNSDFMVKLITDLLHLTKIESGKLKLEPTETDLISLLQRNIELNRLLLESKQIPILFFAEDDLPTVLIDAPKIEQVLNNLIGNAGKFSAPNSTIEVRAHKNDKEILISVKDEGQGIPADEVDRLFIPFGNLSVKSTGGEQSTGLGLAIVKRIVEGHKGRIWVESEVGVGSTFTFSLPLTAHAKASEASG
jgi:signal transduction histidine kinase